MLKKENQNIKLAIKEAVFKLKSKIKIEHYIHKNQLAIESQLTKLISKINPETNNELYEYSNFYDKKDCLKSIYRNLEKLLVFIEKEYHGYLNVNIMVPYRSILIKEYEIKPKLDFVRDSLLSSEINSELLKIVFEPLLVLANINIQKKITYYQFNYASEYINQLAELLHQTPRIVLETDLCNWLVELNNNTFLFYGFKINLIQLELNQCESDIDRLEFLYKKLKKFNQHRTKIRKSFKEGLPKIKVQICSWLQEEIDFLNKRRDLKDDKIENFNLLDSKNKILLGLSVAQISYLINLLIQSGIIQHDNNRDVFRMVSENFKTFGTDNISIDSLSSKFYNVETNTKNKIKEIIIELLNLAKK